MSIKSVFSLSLGGTNKVCDKCTVVDVKREQRPTKKVEKQTKMEDEKKSGFLDGDNSKGSDIQERDAKN